MRMGPETEIPGLYLCGASTPSGHGIGSVLRGGVIAAGVFGWYRYASSGAYVVPTRMGEFTTILNYGRLPYYIKFQFLSRFAADALEPFPGALG